MADGEAAGAGEGQMFAPIGRVEPLDQRGELFEIGLVDPLGAADRQIEPMRDEREMTASRSSSSRFLAAASK